METKEFQHIADVFVRAGWFIPAYISVDFIEQLAETLEKTAPEEQNKVLKSIVPGLYEPESLATMYVGMYSKWPIVSDFEESIAEAIECRALGLLNAATLTLVPIVEGILSRLGETHKVKPDKRSKGIIISTLGKVHDIGKERWAPEAFPEVSIMLTSYKRHFEERFWQNSLKLPEGETLSRHALLHGVSNNPSNNSDYNFARIISVIDLLCFLINVAPPPGTRALPLLAPSDTPESRKLATYYAALENMGTARHTLKVKRA